MLVLAAFCACWLQPGTVQPAGEPVNGQAAETAAVPETVIVKDAELERRVALLELRVLERDAQLEELQARLDEARREVVRAMAKLQTLASRAEAASAMAEAEIAFQSLRTATGLEAGADTAQVVQLLQLATTEFNKHNYGGALYLASQAKSVVRTGRQRLASGVRGSLRPGEVLFALPLRLRAMSRSNVRDGPGPTYRVLFTAEAGNPLIGYSYADQWIRVSDEAGRRGWIFQTLVGRREP